mgnify:CR=1 FL=1
MFVQSKLSLSFVPPQAIGRMWCIFQPHTYTRTKAFLSEFARSLLDADKIICEKVKQYGGFYMRYSDDFMIILPDTPKVDAAKELKQIADMVKQAPRLTLEPSKTQFFHFENGVLTNCGKVFHENADDSSRTINFLGFSFDGHTIRIRAKTVSKYYYRMRRKANNIVKMGGYTPGGKRITGEKLYMAYSRKGAKKGQGNFLTYVDRAAAVYGPKESIKQDTRRHMQKISKVLKGQ